MARRGRGFGGGTGVLFTLIAFVFLTIVAGGIATLMYQRAVKAEKVADDSRKSLERVARTAERTKLETDLADTKGGSLVARLLEDYGQVRLWITGNREEKQTAIQEYVSKNIPEGFTVFGYIEKLAAEKNAADADIVKAKEESKAATDKVAALQTERDALADAFRKATDENKGTYGNLEKGFKSTMASASKNLDSATKDFSQQLSEKDVQVKQQEALIAQKDQEITGLKQRIRELQPKRGEGGSVAVVDPATLPDGTIASILQEENLVYIDRGRRQHIVPGMTFEVYDKATGVSRDDHGDLRGKATIEVVSMSEESSVARIVRRVSRKTILEGDIIANAVYDPNYKFKFMVFGDFDIDQIGQASTSDKLRIKTVITQWGGSLTDDLTYDTDFLVLGQEPKFPDALPPGTIDPDQISKHKAAVERFNEYSKLIAAAKSLSVPVLNQNRFLALVGYYRR